MCTIGNASDPDLLDAASVDGGAAVGAAGNHDFQAAARYGRAGCRPKHQLLAAAVHLRAIGNAADPHLFDTTTADGGAAIGASSDHDLHAAVRNHSTRRRAPDRLHAAAVDMRAIGNAADPHLFDGTGVDGGAAVGAPGHHDFHAAVRYGRAGSRSKHHLLAAAEDLCSVGDAADPHLLAAVDHGRESRTGGVDNLEFPARYHCAGSRAVNLLLAATVDGRSIGEAADPNLLNAAAVDDRADVGIAGVRNLHLPTRHHHTHRNDWIRRRHAGIARYVGRGCIESVGAAAERRRGVGPRAASIDRGAAQQCPVVIDLDRAVGFRRAGHRQRGAIGRDRADDRRRRRRGVDGRGDRGRGGAVAGRVGGLGGEAVAAVGQRRGGIAPGAGAHRRRAQQVAPS